MLWQIMITQRNKGVTGIEGVVDRNPGFKFGEAADIMDDNITTNCEKPAEVVTAINTTPV